MSKTPPVDAFSSSVSAGSALPIVGLAQMDAFLDAQSKLFRLADDAARIWRESLQRSADGGTDLASRLRTATPAEAPALCSSWLHDCATGFAADAQRIALLWVALCASPSAARQDEPTGAERPAAGDGGRQAA